MLYHNGCREAEIRITNNDIENGSHDRLYYFSEYYDIKSINELDPDEYEDTTIYSRNDETGYIGTIKLDMLIKNLTQGKLHPC